MLSVDSLSKSFGDTQVLKNISLDIPDGETTVILGPSGSGKSTLLRTIMGLERIQGGEILLEGKNIVGSSCIEINKKGIARTFQNIRLFDKLTVLDNVKAGFFQENSYSFIEGIFRLPRYFQKEKEMSDRALDLLSVFHLEEHALDFAGNLPYGKQRKLEIARALATNPSLLLLDEPAAGMNPNETEELMDTIRLVRDRFDMTILLIEHDMKLVSGICDRLTVLNFGQVLTEGKTQEVLHDEKVIKAYLGE